MKQNSLDTNKFIDIFDASKQLLLFSDGEEKFISEFILSLKSGEFSYENMRKISKEYLIDRECVNYGDCKYICEDIPERDLSALIHRVEDELIYLERFWGAYATDPAIKLAGIYFACRLYGLDLVHKNTNSILIVGDNTDVYKEVFIRPTFNNFITSVITDESLNYTIDAILDIWYDRKGRHGKKAI